MVTEATVRAVYPVFQDVIAYPPEAVAFWLHSSQERLDPLRWASLYDQGVMLLTAHQLALGRMAGANGGGGGGLGVVSSKSVGGVSIAYNTELGAIEGAGSYNLTTFGREFYQLTRIIGMGGIQL